VPSLALAVVILVSQAAAPAKPAPVAKPAPAAATPASAAAPPARVAAQPVRPPAPDGLSWDESDQQSTTVARIERRLRSGRPAASETLVVTERQLNSFVNLALGPKIPAALSDLRLSLLPGGLAARAMLDLDRVKGKVPNGAASGILALLSGTVPVELRGRLAAANGTGRIEVQEASVGGVGLPASLVAQLVAMSTRTEKQPGGFDIQAPFELPWKARQVRFEAGRALVDFFK
jgi:hypothetical protein